MNKCDKERFTALVNEFTRSTAEIWKAYKESGKASINRHLYEDTVSARIDIERFLGNPTFINTLSESVNDDINHWRELLSKAIATAHELTYRCACTPIGLNFITGEAGLIPRKDQHAAFEAVLELLNEECKKLTAATTDGKTR